MSKPDALAVRDLVIVGAGGHGREVLDIVEAINAIEVRWAFMGFLDDGVPNHATLQRRTARLIGPLSVLAGLKTDYVVGIGEGAVRRKIDHLADDLGLAAAVLVHPSATLGADVVLAPGAVLAAGARVTTNVRLGRHTHLNVSSVVSHDCRLGDYVTLSPGSLVNGSVTLHDEVMLGTGAVVTPGRTIGRRTWVGAGAVVVDDLPEDCVARGVPARVVRSR